MGKSSVPPGWHDLIQRISEELKELIPTGYLTEKQTQELQQISAVDEALRCAIDAIESGPEMDSDVVVESKNDWREVPFSYAFGPEANLRGMTTVFGRAIIATGTWPFTASFDSPPAPVSWAKAFFARWLREIRNLLCDKKQFEGASEAAGFSTPAAAAALGSWVTTTLGLTGPVALALATVALLILIRATGNAFCSMTEEEILKKIPGPPSEEVMDVTI